jgi:hypothetical protein
LGRDCRVLPIQIDALQPSDVLVEIAPDGVEGGDQGELGRRGAAFELLLVQNRTLHRLVAFEPDEVLQRVAGGEAGHRALAVLPDALREVGRYARIQGAVRAVRHDVDGRVIRGGGMDCFAFGSP